MKILAKPIKMVAVFDEQGIPKPLRFQVEENGDLHTINVDMINSTETIRPAGMDALVFRCQSEIQGFQRQYEVIYRIKPHKWELYKM